LDEAFGLAVGLGDLGFGEVHALDAVGCFGFLTSQSFQLSFA
jgi:hypothetical protein